MLLKFSLDQEVYREQPYLVIHIEEQDITGPKRQLYRDVLLKSAGPQGREAAEFLIKEHLVSLGINPLSSQASTVSFQRIRISGKKAKQALHLIAQTKNLFWRGQKLLFDPFSPWKLVFFAHDTVEGKLCVEAQLQCAEQQAPWSECSWFFPGETVWAIRRGICHMLHQEIDAKWLSFAYPAPVLLEGKKKEQFLDLFEDNDLPRAPKVVWGNLQESVKETISVWPVLKLKDRTGAFADLWMDYGSRGSIAVHELQSASWRDLNQERAWEKDLLETDFTKKIVDGSHYYCPMDKVAKSLTFLLEIGWIVYDCKGRRVLKQTQEQLQIGSSGSHLIVKGSYSYDEHEADLKDVVGAFNRRERFIDLGENHVGLFDPSSNQEIIQSLAMEEIVSDGIKVHKAHAGVLEQLSAKAISIDEDTRSFLNKLQQASKPDVCTLDNNFQGTLHPYQQEGVDWMQFLTANGFHGLLADEMGLGKTVQVLAFLSQLHLTRPILIVAPTSLIFNWRREIERFVPSAQIYVHTGPDRATDFNSIESNTWILTSYALLRIDQDLLAAQHYTAVILDEAQVIKNPQSQIAQAAYSLAAEWKLAISGTPVENRWEDLWSLFHFLQPALLGEKEGFRAQVSAGESDNRYMERIRKKIRPFILRRTKSSVALQLPEIVEQTVWVEMPQEQRALYESFLQKQQHGLLQKIRIDGSSSHRMEILEAILRLRQICCHPTLVDGEHSTHSMQNSGKCARLMEDLECIVEEKQKVLVYSQFTQMLHLVENEIKSRGWNSVYLDGSTKDREGIVAKFQEDPDVNIFLISLKAGGVGLNLTAADYVFLLDPWWNDAVERQAINRAHRIGRKETVIAKRYITAYSVEEKMLKIKEKKTHLAQQLLDGSSEEAGSWTIDDLTLLLT